MELKEIQEQAKKDINKAITDCNLDILKREENIYNLIFNRLPKNIDWSLVNKLNKEISDLKVEKRAIEFTQSIYEQETRKLRSRIKLLEGTTTIQEQTKLGGRNSSQA